jgi:isoquinoline 1-oxidoreductase subunit beta
MAASNKLGSSKNSNNGSLNGATGNAPSRRAFLIGAGAAGGFTLGFHIPLDDALAQKAADAAPGPAVAAGSTEVNAWVVIKPDDTCLIRIVRSEMGQGTITGLAQLVAEELECDWKKIKYEYPTPGQSHARKRIWGEMSTGGSRGIRMSHDIVRRGGAAARMMLLQAAADGWKVPVAELTVADGIISHASSKRTISYGKVAAAAAKLTPPDPKTITLKDPKNWKVAGKPLRRLDTADKLNGAKKYTVDLKLPGMLNAAVKAAPVHGNKIASYEEAKVLGMPGVKKVVKVDDNTVAVVADTFWHARKAIEALPITYTETANDKVSSATIAAHLKEGLEPNAANSYVGNKAGDVTAALAGAAKRIEATYSTPFLAHATMEPMTCAAKYTADKAEIWVPTQNGEASHAALAEASGLPLDKCEVYKMDLGGGFGRRGGTQDYVRQATVIAKAMPGTPIKLIWTREEDMAHDFYRPISMCKMSAGLDAAGNLTALQMRVSGQSINAWLAPAAIKDGKDDRQLQGLLYNTPDNLYGYTIPNLSIEYAMRNTHVPVGPWRGVNTNQNGIYSECFIEEVAKAAGKDSLEFRRALMAKHPKHLAVLNAAAAKGDWGKPLPAGVHRGIAQFMGYGSYSAAVAEVSVSDKGKLKVHRLVLALDCGHVVNPDQVAAQVEGSVAYGLTATMYGEVTVKDGRMVEQNFDTYEILRLAEMPKVETVMVPTGDFWGGVGEPTICVVAPAVMNAIFAATGKPVRTLPLKNAKLV